MITRISGVIRPKGLGDLRSPPAGSALSADGELAWAEWHRIAILGAAGWVPAECWCGASCRRCRACPGRDRQVSAGPQLRRGTDADGVARYSCALAITWFRRFS